MMKKKKAQHLSHGIFAFFILLSFFGALALLENQGSLITSFAVKEVSADNPVTATLGIGIPFSFRWQGQEYTLKASAISPGEGKIKLEVSKGSVSSILPTTTTATRSTTPTTSPTRTTTTSPTTSTRTSTSTRTATTTTSTRTAPTTTLAKCRDKIDNDRDGKIDYPADPGCTSLADNDETDVSAATTTSTRTTATTTTSPIRTTTTSTVTGRATSSLKKLGDLELLMAGGVNFDLNGDGTEDVSFTLLEVPSSRQAIMEIKVITETDEGISSDELLAEGVIPTGNTGEVIYSNDLIDINEILDEEGLPTSSYEVTYYFNEIGKRIPFSFPCNPEEKELGNIFAGITEQVKAVYSYDPIEGWLVWNPDTGAANSFDEKISEVFGEDAAEVKFFYGFLIVLNEPAELKIACMPSEAESIALEAGWNLFALRGFEEKTLGEVIAESANLGEANEFKGGKFQKAAKLKELKLQPGKAYWVNAKAPAALSNPAFKGGKK